MAEGQGRPNRNRDQLLADRARVAELLCQGWETADVVRDILSRRTDMALARTSIYHDIREVRKDWLLAKDANYDDHVSQKLAELRMLKRTYWDEWFASKAPRETTVQAQTTGEATTATTNGHGPHTSSLRRAEVRREQRTGNPAYLDGVYKCIAEECKLLGLHAPERVELMFKQNAEDVARDNAMTVDEVLAEADYYIRQHRHQGIT